LISAYPRATDVLGAFFAKLPETQAKFPVRLQYYVPRPTLENDILQVYNASLDEKATGEYTVIVGTNGAGKSSAVAHALHMKPGTLRVKVAPAETSSSLYRKLLTISGRALEEKIDLGFDVLYPVFETIAEAGRPVTIVIEVEGEAGSSSADTLCVVKSTAKELAPVANVIVILSGVNAGLLAFGDDRRQQFIWVDDMTHEEATAFAKGLYPEVADDDLQKFFEKVGTVCSRVVQRPVVHLCHNGQHPHLRLLFCMHNYLFLQAGTLPLDVGQFAMALKRGETADDLIEATLRAAKSDLIGFIHTPILEALKISPDGVRTDVFRSVKHEGVHLAQPKDVAAAMKKQQAIVYHIPSREYRLATRAHRTALLERYNPVLVLACETQNAEWTWG